MATKSRPSEAAMDASTEVEAEAIEGGAATPKPPKEPRPDGAFETRNGSAALVEKGRTFTAGGAKGDAIKQLLLAGELTRKQIAETVGCSQSRVAEVAKVLGLQTRNVTPTAPAAADETVTA
jgi:hypothetical protein